MTTFPVLALSSLFVFLAAIVRGYAGFGFSLLVITALSLLMAPATIIPTMFMLEIAASLHLLSTIWKDIHWRSLAPLIIGCMIGTPLGVWLLANIPAPPMQVALALFVLTAVCFLWQDFALKTMPSTVASGAVGTASGLANRAFGIGGPPVILFYFASPAGTVAGRASLIAYFLMTDVRLCEHQYGDLSQRGAHPAGRPGGPFRRQGYCRLLAGLEHRRRDEPL